MAFIHLHFHSEAILLLLKLLLPMLLPVSDITNINVPKVLYSFHESGADSY